jgi:hypothetical protein
MSFLVVHTNPSRNEMLLNYDDECLILRSMGHQVILTARMSTSFPFGYEGRSHANIVSLLSRVDKKKTPDCFAHNSWLWRLFGGIWVLIGKLLELIFIWIRKHPQIYTESPRIYGETSGPTSQRLIALYQVKPIRGPFSFRVYTLPCLYCPLMYKYNL